MPNLPETVAAFLATASLGATWASAAPEFGPQAVIDRFGQLEPTVLLTVDGYRYGDKDIDIRDAWLRSVRRCRRFGTRSPCRTPAGSSTTRWSGTNSPASAANSKRCPFRSTIRCVCSSRRARPVCRRRSCTATAGITLEAYKNHALSWDLGPGDRLMWFSTTAWMMWNALVSTLLTGASIVCLDGNPMWPDLDAQWRIAEEVRPTMMGLGPAFVMACAKQGTNPSQTYDLSSLRILAAAGSPLPTEGFVWLNEQFGSHAPVYVGSGGTDVCTGLVQGYPIVPVYAGEISAKCLGVAAYAYDDDGNSVIDQLGELVITEPMPSMPVRFWGDHDMSRYRNTYFEQYPGVMRFGDWVRFSDHNTSVITGRSDATLNRGGVRIGTAEIYRVVEQMPEVVDSLVVHLEDPSGGMGELILLVQVGGVGLDETVEAAIRSAIRSALSPRHVPDRIVGVSGVPRNLTGKKLELPVKKILQGADIATVVSRQAMANPDTLDDCLAAVRGR